MDEATQQVQRDAVVRRRARADLLVLALVGVLLLAATAAGYGALYREFYSPSAFVERYLGLLGAGRAADALALPGVAVDSAELTTAGLPRAASEALLRRAALAPLTAAHAVSETTRGGVTTVTVRYLADGHAGVSTFEVERSGQVGFLPAWRFARSPLAMLQVSVRGSWRFTVNGFALDKRQVSADEAAADPRTAVPLLVFAPGRYDVSVDTRVASASAVSVLVERPLTDVRATLKATPTAEFTATVEQHVHDFLSECARQRVLQPTGCPFGYAVSDRVQGLPVWTIAQQPKIALEPAGADWRIVPAEAAAHIEVDIRSLYDGSVRHVSRDVPFEVTGQITERPDGSVTITVDAP